MRDVHNRKNRLWKKHNIVLKEFETLLRYVEEDQFFHVYIQPMFEVYARILIKFNDSFEFIKDDIMSNVSQEGKLKYMKTAYSQLSLNLENLRGENW